MCATSAAPETASVVQGRYRGSASIVPELCQCSSTAGLVWHPYIAPTLHQRSTSVVPLQYQGQDQKQSQCQEQYEYQYQCSDVVVRVQFPMKSQCNTSALLVQSCCTLTVPA